MGILPAKTPVTLSILEAARPLLFLPQGRLRGPIMLLHVIFSEVRKSASKLSQLNHFSVRLRMNTHGLVIDCLSVCLYILTPYDRAMFLIC